MEAYSAGIDLGGTKIYTAIAGKNKKILSRVKVPTGAGKDKALVWENIFFSLEKAAQQAGIETGRVSRIGIGVPGPVDYDSGVVRVCPNIPGWENMPVKKILQEKYRVDTVVENDARAAGFAEMRLGAGKGYNHGIFIILGTGIGGALYLDGKIYRGAHGAAGEIGHTRFSGGASLENLASGPAVQRILGIDPQDLREQVKLENPQAWKALEHLVHYLGTGLGNAVTLLNPEIIVLGGGLANLGNLLIAPLAKEIKKNAFSVSGTMVKIKKAKLKDDAGLLGALELTFD